jgi:hypothetical protein
VRFDRFYTLLNQALPPHFQSRHVRCTCPPCKRDPSRRRSGTPQYKTATALKTDVFKAVVRFERFYTLLNQALPPPFQSRYVRCPTCPPCKRDPSRRRIGTPQYKTSTALKTDVFKAVDVLIWQESYASCRPFSPQNTEGAFLRLISSMN